MWGRNMGWEGWSQIWNPAKNKEPAKLCEKPEMINIRGGETVVHIRCGEDVTEPWWIDTKTLLTRNKTTQFLNMIKLLSYLNQILMTSSSWTTSWDRNRTFTEKQVPWSLSVLRSLPYMAVRVSTSSVWRAWHSRGERSTEGGGVLSLFCWM